LKSKLINYLDVTILFSCCLFIFTYLTQYIATDINAHLEQIKRINYGQANYPANFLFYYIVNLLAGFSNGRLLLASAVFVLSAACTGKYIISKQFIMHFCNAINPKVSTTFSKQIVVIASALFFCFAIPDPFSLFVLKKMYLGKFVPMVWHNSTTIFLFPFAILLFWKQLNLFDPKLNFKSIDIVIINLLVIINMLVKPSFLFTFAPVTLFFLIQRFKVESLKNWILKATPIFTTFLVVLIQYYFIYIKQDGSFYHEQSKVALSFPFELMSTFIPNWFIPFTFIFSFAFIIYTMIVYKEIINFMPFRYALTLAIVGILISAFFIEIGPRALHGNFLWQNVICSYLLFLTTISFITPKLISKKTWTTNDKILGLLFLTHTISGFLYLFKIAITTSYY
jgi:hypothetical protein